MFKNIKTTFLLSLAFSIKTVRNVIFRALLVSATLFVVTPSIVIAGTSNDKLIGGFLDRVEQILDKMERGSQDQALFDAASVRSKFMTRKIDVEVVDQLRQVNSDPTVPFERWDLLDVSGTVDAWAHPGYPGVKAIIQLKANANNSNWFEYIDDPNADFRFIQEILRVEGLDEDSYENSIFARKMNLPVEPVLDIFKAQRILTKACGEVKPGFFSSSRFLRNMAATNCFNVGMAFIEAKGATLTSVINKACAHATAVHSLGFARQQISYTSDCMTGFAEAIGDE